MAASVEMNSVPLAINLENSQPDSQPPIATKLLTESRPVNNSKTSGEDSKSSQQGEDAGDGKSQKIDVPKPKIFDNKNFVEAPLPKTNPWGKPVAPGPEPGKCTSLLKAKHGNFNSSR